MSHDPHAEVGYTRASREPLAEYLSEVVSVGLIDKPVQAAFPRLRHKPVPIEAQTDAQKAKRCELARLVIELLSKGGAIGDSAASECIEALKEAEKKFTARALKSRRSSNGWEQSG